MLQVKVYMPFLIMGDFLQPFSEKDLFDNLLFLLLVLNDRYGLPLNLLIDMKNVLA